MDSSFSNCFGSKTFSGVNRGVSRNGSIFKDLYLEVKYCSGSHIIDSATSIAN